MNRVRKTIKHLALILIIGMLVTDMYMEEAYGMVMVGSAIPENTNQRDLVALMASYADITMTDLLGGRLVLSADNDIHSHTLDYTEIVFSSPPGSSIINPLIRFIPGTYAITLSEPKVAKDNMYLYVSYKNWTYNITGLHVEDIVTIHFNESLDGISVSSSKPGNTYGFTIKHNSKIVADFTFSTLKITSMVYITEAGIILDEVGSYTVIDEERNEPQATESEKKYVFIKYAEDQKQDIEDILPIENDNVFTDIPLDSWFYSSVYEVSRQGLMKGTSDVFFSPQTSVSRGMLTAILYRLEKSPTIVNRHSFSDVFEDTNYDKAISWAAERDIVKGYSDINFAPYDPITREQFLTMLIRYLDYANILPKTTSEKTAASFDDYHKISGYALDAVDRAVSYGLIYWDDYDNNTINPQEIVSRAEVAETIAGMLKLL